MMLRRHRGNNRMKPSQTEVPIPTEEKKEEKKPVKRSTKKKVDGE